MGHWNHRVVKQTDGDETWFGIHEVFYDEEQGTGWTENAVSVIGQSVDDLRWVLEKMLLALDKPVIEDT